MDFPSSSTDHNIEEEFTHISASSQPNSMSGSERSLPIKNVQQKGKEETANWLRTELRQRILDSKTYRKPLNVLLIGQAGVGKSSFLNSVIRSILNKSGNWVLSGSGSGEGRANITAYLRWINILDPQSDDPDRLRPDEIPNDSDSEEESLLDEDSEKRANKLKLKKELKILLRMAPRFIDVCGLPNENNHVNREVLRLLLYGHIPPSENILEAQLLGDKEGAAALRTKYPTGNPDLAVDRVVVVHSADLEVPRELIQAVMEVAQPLTQSLDKEVVAKKAVPVFGLITKSDLVNRMGDEDYDKFESRRKHFINLLALKGDAIRYCECENYVNKHGEILDLEYRCNDPTIDTKILRFMYDLCGRDRHVAHPQAKLEFKQPHGELPPPVEPLRCEGASYAPVRQTSDQTPFGKPAESNAVAMIILALAVYIGVLLHYNVLSNMMTAHPVGIIPAAGLILAPILFLFYFLFVPNNRLA